MNLYCCRIVEQGWGTEYTTEKDYLWAEDEKEARELICKQWQIRRNKKGLRIEEVSIKRANPIKKIRQVTKTESVWNSFLQRSEIQSYWSDETYHVCSKCGGEVSYAASICRHCGALFK